MRNGARRSKRKCKYARSASCVPRSRQLVEVLKYPSGRLQRIARFRLHPITNHVLYSFVDGRCRKKSEKSTRTLPLDGNDRLADVQDFENPQQEPRTPSSSIPAWSISARAVRYPCCCRRRRLPSRRAPHNWFRFSFSEAGPSSNSH